jgi:hypothetical protein
MFAWPAADTAAMRTRSWRWAVGIARLAVLCTSAAQAANYVPNAGFESCAAAPAAPTSWAAVGGESVVCDTTAPEAGAYDVALTSGQNTMLAQAQSACVLVPPGISIDDLSFSYRTSSVAVYAVALSVDAYTGSDCTGANGSASTGAGLGYVQTVTRDGNWHVVTPITASIDPATNSVRFTVSFQAQAIQIAQTVDFDDLSFTANGITTTTQTQSSSTTSTTPGSVTTSTTVPPITGKGNPAGQCFVTVEGLSATPDGHAVCVDGDPTCDADGMANGACAFDFTVCVAEVLSGCHAASITAVKATPESLHVALPSVPASAPTCAAATEVVVPLVRHGHGVGRRTLTLTADNSGKPKHGRNRIRFQCRPHG